MLDIPDDPIIACMMRTGYPPWMQREEDCDGEEWEDEQLPDEPC